MRALYFFPFLLIVTYVSPSTHRVISLRGENVTLPCMYEPQSNSAPSFCWGRETVPTFKCSKTILSSADGAVVYRQSARYQLLGRLTDGDVSLTILNAQWSDAGVYGCRVEIPGWFNDYKVNMHLVIEEAPVEPPTTEGLQLSTSGTQQILKTSLTSNKFDDPFDFPTTTATTAEEQQFGFTEIYPHFMEQFKAFWDVGHICRATVIFFLTVIIILLFTFWRRSFQRRSLKDLNNSATENIYEIIPLPK